MTLNLHLPTQDRTLRPNITVVGVGGAGGNAVNNMISAQLEGVQFVVANTDAQALEGALTERVIQLGRNLTQGLGAGATPEIGQAAAEEAADEIANCIAGSHMVFITAGMGGGTGTGAAPVVARMAREQGMLTVGVVTKPFQFEGGKRMKIAEQGLLELQKYVDTLIVIPNQNLFRVANEKTTFADAFRMADEVLHSGVRGVTDLMIKPGLVNLDFADIRTVMQEMGKAMMGTGEASGEKRAIEAAESAISNPLLDDVSLRGARAALINITGGMDMTLYEVDEAANRIREEIDGDANIIFGSTFNESMQGIIRVSVVATGIDADAELAAAMQAQQQAARPFTKPTNTQNTAFRPTSAYYVGRKPSASTPAPHEGNHNDRFTQPVAAHPTSARPAEYVAKPTSAQPAMRPATVSPAPQQPLRPSPTYGAYDTRRPAGRTEAAPQDAGKYAASSAVKEQSAERASGALHAEHAPSISPAAYHHHADSADAQQEQEGNSGMRILSRLADVGRSLNARVEQHAAPQGRAIEVSEQRYDAQENAESYDDYREHEEDNHYDIPAFLRRKNP